MASSALDAADSPADLGSSVMGVSVFYGTPPVSRRNRLPSMPN